MENVLSVKNLSKDYGSFKLEDVGFVLPKGSIMGLVGENGAGKSTTINLILNLVKKDAGEVSVFGLDHIAHEKEIKKQVGVVLDESSFHDTLNALRISKIMGNLFESWDEALYRHYLEIFKLPEKKTVKEYSRGMKMKLSIAAALSHRPKLLLLDEATSGLDPVVRNEILDILLEFIQDEEHAVLLSSHITSDLERISDYITFIHNGKIIFSKPKDVLLESYGVLKCGVDEFRKIDPSDIVGCRKGQFGYEALIQNRARAAEKYHGFTIDGTTIEEIMLFYARGTEQ